MNGPFYIFYVHPHAKPHSAEQDTEGTVALSKFLRDSLLSSGTYFTMVRLNSRFSNSGGPSNALESSTPAKKVNIFLMWLTKPDIGCLWEFTFLLQEPINLKGFTAPFALYLELNLNVPNERGNIRFSHVYFCDCMLGFF